MEQRNIEEMQKNGRKEAADKLAGYALELNGGFAGGPIFTVLSGTGGRAYLQ